MNWLHLIYNCCQVYHVYNIKMINVCFCCFFSNYVHFLGQHLSQPRVFGPLSSPQPRIFGLPPLPHRSKTLGRQRCYLEEVGGGGLGEIGSNFSSYMHTKEKSSENLLYHYIKGSLIFIIKIPCGRTASMVKINKMSIVLFKCMQVVQKYISLCYKMLNLCLQGKACNRIRINRNFTTESFSKSRHCVHKSQRC